MLRLLWVGAVLGAMTARAEEVPVPVAGDDNATKPCGLFVGDGWRYQHHTVLGGFVKRTLADLVAIPTGICSWDAIDTAVAAVSVAGTVALELPVYPSLDVRLQNSLQNKLGPNHLQTWTPYGDMVVWLALAGGYATALIYGIAAEQNEYVESVVLAIEAYLVTQFYTNVIKLVTGREAPGQGTGEGAFYGPPGYFKLFPAGTPSGHVASMYALISTMLTYWHSPVLWVVLNVFAILFAVTNVADNYHYTSEVLLGSVMGIAIGRWVVRHRSSKYRYGKEGIIERIDLKPQMVPGGGAGFAVSLRW
jgi:membrane-associated phospholipid phosphatase